MTLNPRRVATVPLIWEKQGEISFLSMRASSQGRKGEAPPREGPGVRRHHHHHPHYPILALLQALGSLSGSSLDPQQ